MSKEIPSTLALFPNTYGYGYAFFESADTLTDCGIASVRPINNSVCLERVQQFLDYYKPTVVILEECEAVKTRKSKRVKKLIRSIEELATKEKLVVKKYTREQIRETFQQFNATTKFEIAKTLAKCFPKLKHLAPPYRKAWMAEDYNMGIFDAVSLAVTYFNSFE